jgi:hypothetical protein
MQHLVDRGRNRVPRILLPRPLEFIHAHAHDVAGRSSTAPIEKLRALARQRAWWAWKMGEAASLDRVLRLRCDFAEPNAAPSALRFDGNNPSFSVAPDGSWLVFTELDSWDSDVEMIDGFH